MLDNLIVPKARKPKFELVLRLYDLNNVPLVTGTSYIKWHLPTSTAAEHRGRTPAYPIKEHKVTYDYSRVIPLRFTISKENTLLPSLISFEVVQDYTAAGKPDKITIGRVELNLAEYVEEGEVGHGVEDAEGDIGVVRRYLMQESKINSTLKIGIGMRQVDGDRTFVAPPLRTAPVFGGIAGIMAGEQEEGGDLGHMPALSKSRDQGELQDMYRRALAASWAANSAELPADQCIEDIFAGGDGWKRDKSTTRDTPRTIQEDSGSDEDRDRRHHRTQSGSSSKSQSTVTAKKVTSKFGRHRHTASHGSQESLTSPRLLSGSATMDGGMDSSEGSERGRVGFRPAQEVDEFDVRDNLMAWRLPDKSPGAMA